MNRNQQRDESLCASQAAGESASAGPAFPCDESFWKVFDDVCKDYMLTPPQSPPVSLSFDQADEAMVLDESLSAALDGLLEESGLTGLALDSFESGDMAILSDCMWSSGPEDGKFAGKSNSGDAALLLSGAFEHILVSEEPLVAPETLEAEAFDDEDASQHSQSSDSESDDPSVACPRPSVPGSDSLIDHSYGSTSCAPASPHLNRPVPASSKLPKRLSSSSSSASSSCSSTSLLSAEYRTGKSKRLAEKRRAKQKLLEADPVTVKFVKRTASSPASGRKQAVIRCKTSQRKSLTACADRVAERAAERLSSQQSVQPPVSLSLSPVPSTPKSETVLVLSHSSPVSSSSCQSILREPVTKKKKEKHFPERRREHNDSEKKRRDQLRNAFLSLRDQIPKFRDQGRRPPRIHILFEAASYVTTLAEKSAYLEKMKSSETVKRDKLLRRLRLLQSQ